MPKLHNRPLIPARRLAMPAGDFSTDMLLCPAGDDDLRIDGTGLRRHVEDEAIFSARPADQAGGDDERDHGQPATGAATGPAQLLPSHLNHLQLVLTA